VSVATRTDILIPALEALNRGTAALAEAKGAIEAAIAASNQGEEKEPDRMLTVDEAAARLRRSRQWIYRHADRLPFVRRLSRKSLLCSESGLNAYLAAKPASRHNTRHGQIRSDGKDLGQAAAKHHGEDENPRGERKDFAARADRNGTRNLSQNTP
jgi:hypothetical protein